MEGKFRVWCKDKNEWERDMVFLNQNGTLFHIMNSGMPMPLKQSTHIVQFYTGIYDRKGNRIFDGDIVKVASSTSPIWKVVYQDDNGAFYLKRNKILAVMTAFDWIEVVGNIYEHADLLQGITNE